MSKALRSQFCRNAWNVNYFLQMQQTSWKFLLGLLLRNMPDRTTTQQQQQTRHYKHMHGPIMLHVIHWTNATSKHIGSDTDPTTKPTINNKHQVHHLHIRNEQWLKGTTSITIITKHDRWLPTTGIIVYCCYYLERERAVILLLQQMLGICALIWILALIHVHVIAMDIV